VSEKVTDVDRLDEIDLVDRLALRAADFDL
jgi:hypothetical protein